MKPFSDTGLTRKQKKFNYQLSRSRAVVENAFGRLKGRWRSLMKRNDTNIKKLSTLVTACCIVHNLCEAQGDSCEEDWIVPIASTSHPDTTHFAFPATSTASSIREALCNYFDSN